MAGAMGLITRRRGYSPAGAVRRTWNEWASNWAASRSRWSIASLRSGVMVGLQGMSVPFNRKPEPDQTARQSGAIGETVQ
ncbi:hypothetical protein Psi02_12660 [Planotetraspora silvatica]|uniref:Uncharacterized protein n=1 Tax=Planotetraspora silvatica TaxID=234614 RepID=A0A8J3XK26_9ACTN|nr:hypothetical protein Psi02_12660 [Planotetraspora silvatica]